MIILGIDPGLADTGYGVITTDKQQYRLLAYGTIRTLAKTNLAERLLSLQGQLRRLIKKHRPDIIAVEELFFAKNIKTAISVAHARGLILSTAAESKSPIREFTPLQVKQALTGYGRAEKGQMQKMVKTILGLKEIPKPDDAADALAVAVCCGQTKDPLSLGERARVRSGGTASVTQDSPTPTLPSPLKGEGTFTLSLQTSASPPAPPSPALPTL